MKYLIACLVMIMGFQAFIYWPVLTSPAAAAYEWRSLQEKKEFQRLLKKHGLDRKISVVFYDGKQKYFINEKGQKCRFI